MREGERGEGSSGSVFGFRDTCERSCWQRYIPLRQEASVVGRISTWVPLAGAPSKSLTHGGAVSRDMMSATQPQKACAARFRTFVYVCVCTYSQVNVCIYIQAHKFLQGAHLRTACRIGMISPTARARLYRLAIGCESGACSLLLHAWLRGLILGSVGAS